MTRSIPAAIACALLFGLSAVHASVRFDASAERVFRTATVPAFGDFSISWWAYHVSNLGDYEYMPLVYESSGGTAITTRVDGSGVPQLLRPDFTTATSSAGAWSTGTWRRFAMVFDNAGDLITLYEGDADPATALTSTATLAYTGSFTTTEIAFSGALLGGAGYFDGRVANLKMYTAVKSAGFLKTELQYFNVQNSTGLWGAWVLKAHTALTDSSGSSRDLSANGTVSTEADPPITDAPTGGATCTGSMLRGLVGC